MLKRFIGTIWQKITPSLRVRIVRATQRQFTVSVAVIVVNQASEILLLDHVLRPDSGWGIPGGFINRGEQPADAAQRELREETGIKLKDLKLLTVRTINRHVEIVFRAEASGEATVKSREIYSLGWFKVNEMPENMNRIQKSIVENYLANQPIE